MADTYGVAASDVASGLPGLFPSGFGESTAPTSDAVASFIATADAVVTLHLQRATGVTPLASDDTAPLARDYIVNATKAQVLRVVYTGNAPQDVAAAAKPYDDLARAMLDRIDALERARPASVAFGFANMPSSSTRAIARWF